MATLHSSNKCTVLVNSMVWVGQCLLTVGLRFVKCWKPEDDVLAIRRDSEPVPSVATPRQRTNDFGNSILSPRHKVLSGKNSLLGDLIDANFVAAVAVSEDNAMVCTDAGELCLLSDCSATQTLTMTANTAFRATAVMLDESRRVVAAGPSGKRKTFALDSLSSPLNGRAHRRQTITPIKTSRTDIPVTLAMGSLQNAMVELDSMRGITLSKSDSAEEQLRESNQLVAHSGAVQGVQNFSSSSIPASAFLTFSSDGSIHIWTAHGINAATLQVPVESSSDMYDMVNELKAVASLQNGTHIAAGDKYGTLTILNGIDGSIVHQVRAHSAEIADIVATERSGMQILATASRDRTVQLFIYADGVVTLLQTMDEHAAAVNSLLFSNDGNMLLSCSADRTIIVRDAVENQSSVAYIMARAITLKSSPVSMCFKSDDELVVATADRNIAFFSINNGQAGFTFKCSDAEGVEAAALSKILYAPSLNGNPTILGVSSGDKSVRLYSEYGSLLARDWGHTEGITDLALIQRPMSDDDESKLSSQLVTVAADSTVFIWHTVSSSVKSATQQPEANVSETTPANKLSTPLGPPLRKVLSFSELSRFSRQRSVDDSVQEPSGDKISPTHPPPSPPRVKKKSSRMSMAQPPRLEPAFRSSFADSTRRGSARKRSPSPPSPRNSTKKDLARKPSLGMSLRSKSSDNVLTTAMAGNASGYGSLSASTESVCRTLRAYRKKLANSATPESVPNELFQELEKELKLTVRFIGEKSQGKNIDEAMLSRLLEDASEKIVSRLDERIKERVESEIRRSGDASPSTGAGGHSPNTEQSSAVRMEAVAGALETMSLRES
jgi:mitogen-activated protein kinase binding protein 1